MSTLHVNLIGRFGNQMFQYAYARAYALKQGAWLTTSPWVGEEIFDLPIHRPIGSSMVPDEQLSTEYHQDQDSLIYTRKQVKEWFRFKPEIQQRLNEYTFSNAFDIVAHRRIGDYPKSGYVVVSKDSYYNAVKEFTRKNINVLAWVSEENSTGNDGNWEDYPFLLDFYVMMRAIILLRGNSTFSWWAATLGNAKVYSPVIEGLEGGKEQDCKFVEGNWPRFANLPFITDLHLEEG